MAIAFVVTSPNRLGRFDVWLGRDTDEFGAARQPIHGRYALADGGWFGLGLGASREKWGLLSEPHNDFIFAIIGEELGLPGTIAILLLFAGLALACYRLVTRTGDLFVRIATAGIMTWLIVQALINIGAVIGLLPVIGVPLPLVSSGGSSLITSMFALGILLSFARAEPGCAEALSARPVGPAPLAGGHPRRRPLAPDARMSPEGPRSVLLAGGGTAGHVSPLLALADCLRRRDPEVVVTALGTAAGLEARLVPERGYPLLEVPKVPFPRRPSGDLLRLPANLRRAVRAAEDAIDSTGAEVVVGFGGYVSTPAYLAARRRGTPVVVHEQNARPGLANRLGARFAAGVGVTFPGTRLPHAMLTGMPLRREIATLDRAAHRAEARDRFGLTDAPTVLVTGGSLGAQKLNEAFAGAAAGAVGGRRPGAARRRHGQGVRPRRGERCALRGARVLRPDGPRLRRRRPGGGALRRQHGLRAHRRRAARRLRAPAGRQRRAAAQRRRRHRRRGRPARRRRRRHTGLGR